MGWGDVRPLPCKVNMGDNWSHELTLIWCYCCDNKHLRTIHLSLFMFCSNVLAASEAQTALTVLGGPLRHIWGTRQV